MCFVTIHCVAERRARQHLVRDIGETPDLGLPELDGHFLEQQRGRTASDTAQRYHR